VGVHPGEHELDRRHALPRASLDERSPGPRDRRRLALEVVKRTEVGVAEQDGEVLEEARLLELAVPKAFHKPLASPPGRAC